MSRPGPPAPLRPLALALGLGVLVVLVVGCSQGGPAPTQAQYAAAADQVCQGTADTLTELEEDHEAALAEERSEDPGATDQRPERWVRARVVPAYQEMEGGLRGIQPPDGDGEYLADLYDDLGRRIEELRLGPSRGRDQVRADADLRRRFASYGMEVCGTV